MQITRRLRWQFLAQSGVFVLLLALLVALLAYFAREYRVEHDLTRGARNTLSATTLGALKQLQGPVSVTAYAVRQDSSGTNVHKAIEERVRAYQRAKHVEQRVNTEVLEQVGLTQQEVELICARHDRLFSARMGGARRRRP